MGIWYNVYGHIVLRENTDNVEKLSEIFGEHCKIESFKNRFNNTVLKLEDYQAAALIQDVKTKLEENINDIESAQIDFTCHDEDCVPFLIMLEVANGNITEQSLQSNLPPEWHSYDIVPLEDGDEPIDRNKPSTPPEQPVSFNSDDLPF